MRRVISKPSLVWVFRGILWGIALALLLGGVLPNRTWAQPPEEIPPQDQGTDPQPEAAAKANPKAPVFGTKFLVDLMIMPYGMDQIGLEGASQGAEFFGVQPSVAILKSFPTALGTPVSLALANRFTWMEYYDRSAIKRGVENLLFGRFGFPLSKRTSGEVDGFFHYGVRSGSQVANHNITALGASPNLWFKPSDTFHLKFGYSGRFMQFMNIEIEVETAPQFLPDYEYVPFGQYGGVNSFASVPIFQEAYLAQHGIVGGFKWVPLDSTQVGFEYEYVFAHNSNVSFLDIGGHVFTVSLEQDLWKGAKTKLKNASTFYTADFSALGGPSNSPEFNNMLQFELVQTLTKHIHLEGALRYQLRDTAAAALRTIDGTSTIFLGTKFRL